MQGGVWERGAESGCNGAGRTSAATGAPQPPQGGGGAPVENCGWDRAAERPPPENMPAHERRIGRGLG